ncbi:glycosyltransferase [Zunongwangia sp. F260]|uniref:Glycosyltransferase n=1 Tax=Autumnicola lenta TaxID=3075593 RepID=A0ABU3CG33_9FLAO|nr:glycosyltransferase [Zunongwangia sp. F260]MDT0645318.1 glycosyltransferase [Zunongwangia sp. F260]
MSIPKVIHYCWFGNKLKPQLVDDCITSWKEILTDYNIIEWNEKNTDLKHPFIKKAYRQKKWAFVSDFVRLKVLYEYGGIYLDTDMLILKALDDFLEDKCFFGAEDEEYISAGIIGSIKYHQFIYDCLQEYEKIKINNETSWLGISVPKIITQVFKNNFNFDGFFKEKKELYGIVVYPSSYFYSLNLKNRGDIKNYRNYLTDDSYAVHLWNSSWIEPNEYQYIRNKQYYKGLKKVMSNIISNRSISFFYLRKILSSLKESLLTKQKKKLP